MIAERMKELVKGSSVIRAMFEEGKKMAAQYGAENVYDFSLGNPSVEPPKEIGEAIKSILDSEKPTVVHGYMNNAGYEEVRNTIALSLNKRFDTEFTAKNILMTVGAAGGLNVILKTILDPGDVVVTIAPYFGEYRNYVANFGGTLAAVPADRTTFLPDLDAFEKALTPATKAVIINTPNNPTGVVYSKETIENLSKVLENAEKRFGTSIYLISDEPYRELVYDGVEVPYITKFYHNAVVGYSFSKSLSLPGERIGYLVLPDTLDDADEVINAANVANRILGFVNAPSLMQLAVARCLDAKVNVEAYDKNRKLLYGSLTKMGFECIKPEGAFYLFMKCPIEDDKEFAARAKKYNLLLVPGSSFGGPGYVRIAYCVDHAMIERSLPAFEKLAAEFGLK